MINRITKVTKVTKFGSKKKPMTKKQKAMRRKRMETSIRKTYSSFIDELERSGYNANGEFVNNDTTLNEGFVNDDTTPTKPKTYVKRKH